MKIRIILNLFIVFAFVSCKKTETKKMVSLTGVVMDYDNNTVFPNVRTGLGRLVYKYPHSYYITEDSTRTNSNGVFQFSHPYNEGDLYFYLSAYKNGYAQKYQRLASSLSGVDAAAIQKDTLFIGQATFLSILIKNNSGNKRYVIECNMNIPPESFDSLADYNPIQYHIHEYDSARIIIDRYLYKDNHLVYISWRETYNKRGVLNKTTEVIQMTPMDTTFITLNLP